MILYWNKMKIGLLLPVVCVPVHYSLRYIAIFKKKSRDIYQKFIPKETVVHIWSR
jgi:hypothetical protein